MLKDKKNKNKCWARINQRVSPTLSFFLSGTECNQPGVRAGLKDGGSELELKNKLDQDH